MLQVFWRTGGFVLGHILETAFKDNIYVELMSFPTVPSKLQHGPYVS